MFENKFMCKARPDFGWKHETASVAMFDHLVEVNNLKPVMEEHGLVMPEDLDFIKEQIAGPQRNPGQQEIMNNWKKELAESSKLQLEDFVVVVVVFDYGKDKDPIEKVRFYSKSHPNKPIQIIKKKVSKLLPETFKEQQIRVYCKRTDETTLEAAKSAFKE